MSLERAKQFEVTLREEREHLRKNFRLLLAVYGLFIVFLIGYTTFVFTSIKSFIGPEGLQLRGETVVNTIALYPDQLIRNYDQNKDVLADQLVNQALNALPAVEELVKNQLDAYSDELKIKLRKKVLPGLSEYIKGSAPEFKNRFEEKKRKKPELTIGMFLTDVFVEYLDAELATLLNEDGVIAQAEDLQMALHALGKNDKHMTRKQEAERKILINFILMSQLGTNGSPILEGLHQYLEDKFGVKAEQVQEDKVLPDVNTDDKQEAL